MDYGYIQDGALKIAKLPYRWLKMVDITIVTGSFFMLYKPTSISGGPKNPVYLSSISIGLSLINHPFLGTIYGHHRKFRKWLLVPKWFV